jgi:pimeloyl-ACP methyl ester carboxylesterase
LAIAKYATYVINETLAPLHYYRLSSVFPMSAKRQMNEIESKNVTIISYVRRGHGPALLLVHGTAADHGRWNLVVPALKEQFTVYAIDRGGRDGHDSAAYRMESEFTELAALIDAIEEGPVDIVAHSYGAICALEAARRTIRVRRLALYEPPIPNSRGAYHAPEILTNIRHLIARDEREAALNIFYSEVAQIPPRELLAMRALPSWKRRVNSVHTVLRELESMARYDLQPDRFRDWQIPTLLLLGGNSPAVYRAGVERLHAVLPRSAITVLEGQGHMAMKIAPKLFVREILAFLKEDGVLSEPSHLSA